MLESLDLHSQPREIQNKAERMNALGKSREANRLFLSLCLNQLQEMNSILNGNLYLSKKRGVFWLMKPCQFDCNFEINVLQGCHVGKIIFSGVGRGKGEQHVTMEVIVIWICSCYFVCLIVKTLN